MPTTNTTQTSQQASQQQSGSQNSNSTWGNSYNPAAMSAYNQLIPQWQSQVSGLISNPFNNPWFNTARGMMGAQVGQQAQTQQSQMLNNMQSMGINNSPYAASQMARLGRSTSGQQAQGYNNLLLNTQGMGMQALGMAQSFNPLVTGGTQSGSSSYTGQGTSQGNSNSVQSTGGIGSWLTPLASAGMGFLAGGAGGLFGGGSQTSPTNSMGMQMPGTVPYQGMSTAGQLQYQSPGQNPGNLYPGFNTTSPGASPFAGPLMQSPFFGQ